MSKFEEVQRRKARKRQRAQQEANAIKKKLKNMGFGKAGSKKRLKRLKLLAALAEIESK